MNTISEFVGHIPPVTEWRIVCGHSVGWLERNPKNYRFPVHLDTHHSVVELRYDPDQYRYVGQCRDCGRHYYALVERGEPPNVA